MALVYQKSPNACENAVVGDERRVRDSILEENRFIKSMVDLIPMKLYFDADKVQQVHKRNREEMSKRNREIGRPQNQNDILISRKKRARLDPSLRKTVSQLCIDPLEDEGKEVYDLDSEHIDDLKVRLKAKLAALKDARLAKNEDKAKRTLKRQSNARSSKKNKKDTKHLKKLVKPIPERNSETAMPKSEKPVINKENKMLFSKLEFNGSGEIIRGRGEYSGKDYKNLLQKVQKDSKKIRELQSSDAEKGKLLLEKKQWKTALQKMEGVKVKDDPHLLKKAIKKREHLKKRSEKQWKNREDSMKQRQAKRQKKRMAHINSRIKEKAKKKLKRALKKGRMIPGYV